MGETLSETEGVTKEENIHGQPRISWSWKREAIRRAERANQTRFWDGGESSNREHPCKQLDDKPNEALCRSEFFGLELQRYF